MKLHLYNSKRYFIESQSGSIITRVPCTHFNKDLSQIMSLTSQSVLKPQYVRGPTPFSGQKRKKKKVAN